MQGALNLSMPISALIPCFIISFFFFWGGAGGRFRSKPLEAKASTILSEKGSWQPRTLL